MIGIRPPSAAPWMSWSYSAFGWHRWSSSCRYRWRSCTVPGTFRSAMASATAPSTPGTPVAPWLRPPTICRAARAGRAARRRPGPGGRGAGPSRLRRPGVGLANDAVTDRAVVGRMRASGDDGAAGRPACWDEKGRSPRGPALQSCAQLLVAVRTSKYGILNVCCKYFKNHLEDGAYSDACKSCVEQELPTVLFRRSSVWVGIGRFAHGRSSHRGLQACPPAAVTLCQSGLVEVGASCLLPGLVAGSRHQRPCNLQ